ncbi:hypothetical protein [Pantoea sp. GD03673]|uniref:hypothetical protein n=1 Tax=Pantoea sp. GD03673 TaxID=2975364 RepID=UPI00244D3E63|nr:hypothetical protein [Pantoea sp. GD03673]MDH2066244.1 hypothetical protein [Pantoea sp. GD03673]
MKCKVFLNFVFFMMSCVPFYSFSDVTILSPLGTSVTFSDKKTGENYDSYSWGVLTFKGKKGDVDLGIKDRYFTEDGSSKVSPSGRYLVVNSVSGGYLQNEAGEKEYVDKAFCSVVDMKNGCYVSDWDGEACGYEWNENEDVLENSQGTDKFDFLSFRPKIDDVKDSLSSLSELTVRRYMRCDSPGINNINIYSRLSQVNKASKLIVNEGVLEYLKGVTEEKMIIQKSFLYSSPNDGGKTASYLVAGDKVKILQFSKDRQWINVGYINVKGTPLVAWILAEFIDK